MIEFIGWIGTACFSICAIPQAWTSYKTKSAKGLSGPFLFLWIVGEVCALTYILGTSRDPIIWIQYVVNLVCLVVILYYFIYGD